MADHTIIDLAKKDSRSFDKATDQRHTFQLKRHQGYVLEMEDVLFHFDSAVMIPDYESDPDVYENLTPYTIRGLAVLRACHLHASEHPAHKLFITGHTDLTGTESYNLRLSMLRADNVLYALTGNRDGWGQAALQKHQVED